MATLCTLVHLQFRPQCWDVLGNYNILKIMLVLASLLDLWLRRLAPLFSLLGV